jgi:hypothetical protein
MTDRIRSSRSSLEGSVNRAPAWRSWAFARLIRVAIVASLVPYAWAISAVVSPPTARNVNATWEVGLNAGWQHSTSNARLSSAPEATTAPDASGATAAW